MDLKLSSNEIVPNVMQHHMVDEPSTAPSLALHGLLAVDPDLHFIV